MRCVNATPERPDTAEAPAHEVALSHDTVPSNEPGRRRDAGTSDPVLAHVPPAREPAVVNGLAAAVQGVSRARSGEQPLRDAAPALPAPAVPAESDGMWSSPELAELAGPADEVWAPVRLSRSHRRHRPTRHAAKRSARRTRRQTLPVRTALSALIALALAGTFFAWVSAEPIWLAVGRGDTGTAMVTSCVGDGLTQRCQGSFMAKDGTYTTEGVRLLGVTEAQAIPGTQVQAKMVHSGSERAYLGDQTVMTLRWLLGLVLVLLSGVGIVFATGALRLENRRSRRIAALCGLTAPLLVTIGFLAATF